MSIQVKGPSVGYWDEGTKENEDDNDDGPDSKLLKASEIGKIFTQQQDHQQCQFQNTQNMLTMLTC